MQRFMLTFTSVLLLVLTAPPADAEWVLPPEAGPAVQRAANVRPRADKTGVTRSAALNKNEIVITAKRDGTMVMNVTLVHPSMAPEDAFRGAGVALLEEPGPVDTEALAALRASLTAAKRPVPWVETEDEPVASSEETEAKAEQALTLADRLLDSGGDLAKARAALDALPDKLPPALAVRAAVLWQRLESPDFAKAALAGLGTGSTPAHAIAAAVLGAKVDAAAALGKTKGEEACAFTELSHALAALARPQEALTVALAVLERAGDCPAAWETALHRRVEAGDADASLALADKALARFPQKDASVALLSTIGSVYLTAGRHLEAVALLEAVASRDPADERAFRTLLSAVLRDPKERGHHTERLEKRHADEPDNPIVQLLLGVLRHYANEFDASNALLTPLEATMGHQSRLHIYLALNDFNQDKAETALARFDTLAKRDNPDPMALYCRAEVTRDSNREAARADLVRYQAMVRASGVSNPDQDTRITELIAALDACIVEQKTRCRGAWENPRIVLDSSTRAADAPAFGGSGSAALDAAELAEPQGPLAGAGLPANTPSHVTKLVIHVATGPDDYGGNVFLVGYWTLDIAGRPVAGGEPGHFRQLGMWVRRFPFRVEASLAEGLHYRVFYSHHDYPTPQDPVSTIFQIGSDPPNEISISVDRYADQRGVGPAGDDSMEPGSGGPGGVQPSAAIVIHLDPPPEDTSGSIFLAGFKSVNPDTGMPGRNELPSDYHVIEGVDGNLPVERGLDLVPGLHYLAMYGFGQFPGEGDRLSVSAAYNGQPTLSFTIKDQFAGGDPSMGDSEGPGGGPGMDRAWLALLIGLLVAGAAFWMIRRRK